MNSMEKGEAGENHLSDFEANTTGFFFFLINFIIINLFSEKGSRSDLDISPERILTFIHFVLGEKDLHLNHTSWCILVGRVCRVNFFSYPYNQILQAEVMPCML